MGSRKPVYDAPVKRPSLRVGLVLAATVAVAMLVATVLVLAVSAVTNLVSARRRRTVPAAREPEHCEST